MLNDDQTHTIKTQTTTAPPIFVEPDALPPMPQAAPIPQVVPMPQMQPPVVKSGSAAPSDDIVMAPIVTTTTPKKKFAGGKIIATILGLFLLVGGVGAGVYLTGQNQNPNEKAAGGVPPRSCPISGCNEYTGPVTESNGGCCTSSGVYRDGGRSATCNKGDYCISTRTEEICTSPESMNGDHCLDDINIDCNPSEVCDNTPPATTPPTSTPPTAGVPVCQSATISKNTLTGPGDSLTITSTATTSDITGFSYGFYNKDNLYPSPPDNNAKPIWFVPNTHYVKGATISPTNSNTITVTYDELNRLDLNWGSGQQKPTKISVNAFFGNSAGWNHSDANCIEQFNIAVAEVATLSCNSNCDFYNGPADQCGQGRLCLNVGTGAPQAKCRNPQCSSSTNCICTSTGSLSCTSLTSNIASPVVGQSITGTCRGSVPSSATSPVARFAVTLNGTVLGASESIPLNSAGTASYTATVPQQGNYLVQCQICTDSTLSNCTTMGQAN